VAVVDSTGWYIGALLSRGATALATQELEAYARLLAEFPQPHFQWRLPLSQALFRAFAGDFVAADRLSDEAHALATSRGSAPGLRAWGVQRVAFAQMRGTPSSIAPDAPEILRLFETIQVHIPSAAWVLAASGEHEQAAQRLRDSDIATGYFPALIIAADAAVMLGDVEIAQRLYAPLLAHAPAHDMFVGPAGASAFGPTARVLGDMALLLGHPADAIAHYDQAIALCERIGAVPFVALTRRARDLARARLDTPIPTSIPTSIAAPGAVQLDVRREGDVWAIECSTGPGFRLKHSKGLAYLRTLIDRPGREVHVLELVGVDHPVGDAGPALDPRAKAAYRARLDDLKDDLDEAERFGDTGRRERAQAEFEAITDQLAGAVGLGGRDRRAASDVERARINVQRRFKDTLDRIAQHDAILARYLTGALQTGIYCSFTPR
jgi:hypothetical protein